MRAAHLLHTRNLTYGISSVDLATKMLGAVPQMANSGHHLNILDHSFTPGNYLYAIDLVMLPK